MGKGQGLSVHTGVAIQREAAVQLLRLVDSQTRHKVFHEARVQSAQARGHERCQEIEIRRPVGHVDIGNADDHALSVQRHRNHHIVVAVHLRHEQTAAHHQHPRSGRQIGPHHLAHLHIGERGKQVLVVIEARTAQKRERAPAPVRAGQRLRPLPLHLGANFHSPPLPPENRAIIPLPGRRAAS